MSIRPIELTFENQLADHLTAERLYYSSTLFWKLDKVVVLLLVSLGGYFVWHVGPRWWTLVWFPLAIAESFNLQSLRPLQVIYWFKHNPKFRETYHLTLDRDGIHFRTSSIDSRLKWDHYTGVLKNRRLYLLVYGTRMYSVIPKRAFKSPAELGSFQSLVRESINIGLVSAQQAHAPVGPFRHAPCNQRKTRAGSSRKYGAWPPGLNASVMRLDST